jgi:hypothetical protein
VSRNRVELVEALFELWNSGERDFALLSEYLDPAIELESPFSSVVGEPYRGYSGIEQWIRDIDEQFVQWSIRADKTSEVGGQVIAMVTVTARGRGSDIAMRLPQAGVLDFASDRRVTRIRIYSAVTEALKVVGLEE